MFRAAVALAVCALALGALPWPGAAQPAPVTWNAVIGGDSADHLVQAQDFFPRTITVNAGDTITWTKATRLEHTVSFLSGAAAPEIFLRQPDHTLLLNPLVALPKGGKIYAGAGYLNSGGLRPLGATFRVTFTKPGRYTYVCILHPGMTGTVIVQPVGSAYPMSQAANDGLAASQKAAALEAGERLRATQKVTATPDAGGTIYTAALIADPAARISYFGFTTPAVLRIKAGDTVRWILRDPFEIHTITFPGGQPLQEFVSFQPTPQMPLRLLVSPQASDPAGGAVHTGNTFHSSGILMPVGEPGPKEYVLKFTTPGTYTYWCIPHIPEGMRGIIDVE